jgi:hypothetical protein
VSVSRGLIYFALNEIVSNKEGMQFQGLAVVLAKDRWPEFVACERKWDLGLDAYAAASVSPGPRNPGLGTKMSWPPKPTI